MDPLRSYAVHDAVRIAALSNLLNLRILTMTLALAVSVALPTRGQSPPSSATELIEAVVGNELADHAQQRRWMFMVQKREGSQTFAEEQVESKDGPLYRLLTINGRPLSPSERQQDTARLDRLLHDRNQQLKLKRGHDEDEQRLEELTRLMPQAFLYNWDGMEGNLVRLKFRPRADYSPPTYEARVMRSLAGTILIDPQQKRLAKVSAQLINRVEFGYGLLGHVDGGTVEIRRIPVGPSQWRTAVIDVQLTGRLLLFKSISKQEYEIRSEFRPVPDDLSLSEANELLISAVLRVPAL